MYKKELKKSKGVLGRKWSVNRGESFTEYHFHYVNTVVV